MRGCHTGNPLVLRELWSLSSPSRLVPDIPGRLQFSKGNHLLSPASKEWALKKKKRDLINTLDSQIIK